MVCGLRRVHLRKQMDRGALMCLVYCCCNNVNRRLLVAWMEGDRDDETTKERSAFCVLQNILKNHNLNVNFMES